MDFQDSIDEGAKVSQPAPGAFDTEFCEEPLPTQPELNSEQNESQQKLTLGPNLLASAGASDVPLGLEGNQNLIAQVPICDLGGIAPPAGGVAGAAFPLAPVLGAVGTGGLICGLVCGGGDDPPAVPEPSDVATGGLFAVLGISGVLYSRKRRRS